MHCFQHQDTHAVGFCMNCGAATCTACLQRTVGNRIACSRKCADNLNRLIAMGQEGITRAARSHAVTAWFACLIGASLLGYSAYAVLIEDFPEFLPYGLGMGTICAGIGFLYWRLARQFDGNATDRRY